MYTVEGEQLNLSRRGNRLEVFMKDTMQYCAILRPQPYAMWDACARGFRDHEISLNDYLEF
jgi:hypothetical protein